MSASALRLVLCFSCIHVLTGKFVSNAHQCPCPHPATTPSLLPVQTSRRRRSRVGTAEECARRSRANAVSNQWPVPQQQSARRMVGQRVAPRTARGSYQSHQALWYVRSCPPLMNHIPCLHIISTVAIHSMTSACPVCFETMQIPRTRPSFGRRLTRPARATSPRSSSCTQKRPSECAWPTLPLMWSTARC